jgi:hypothetical protein
MYALACLHYTQNPVGSANYAHIDLYLHHAAGDRFRDKPKGGKELVARDLQK